MPTVVRWGPHRAFFYSADSREPPHVHVTNEESEAKFWLRDMSVAWNAGYAAHELASITRHLRGHKEELLESWNEHFGD